LTTNDLTPSGLPPTWSVQLPVFEGPLDLLLHLVRVNQVEITEIPVATICDQFHETLRLMEVLNLDIAAEYIYEAAQLIYLKSRMLLDREQRIRARSLNQDQPFACISCGKPFAPTSVIHKMQTKLKGHYMFSTERALDRLKMCDNCRVADIVTDPDAMGGQFDPLKNFRQ